MRSSLHRFHMQKGVVFALLFIERKLPQCNFYFFASYRFVLCWTKLNAGRQYVLRMHLHKQYVQTIDHIMYIDIYVHMFCKKKLKSS